MPWDNARPRRRIYDAGHNKARAQHMARLRAVGMGRCMERVCVMPSRVITPDMDLHLCHDHLTGGYLGLGHSICNRREAAKRARGYQDSTKLVW
jgi:hypothetical protein